MDLQVHDFDSGFFTPLACQICGLLSTHGMYEACRIDETIYDLLMAGF